MRVNKYKPHVLVLPEDRANADMVNGFLLHPHLNERSIQVLPYAHGWLTVLEQFKADLAPKMRQYSQRGVILLIDFDREVGRLDRVMQDIPDDLRDRVFILGVLSEPEKLKRILGKSYEEIGEDLAMNCPDNPGELWQHDLLKHNQPELGRLTSFVKSFLFS
jgi:hypothetical protein